MKINKILMNMLLLISFIKIFTLTSFADSDGLKINNFKFTLSSTEVTVNNPATHYNNLNSTFSYSVSNKDNTIKPNDKIVKVMRIGPFTEGIYLQVRATELDMVATNGVNYGKLNVTTRIVSPYREAVFTFTFNENISNVDEFSSEVYAPSFAQYVNFTYDTAVKPFDIDFDGVKKTLGGRSAQLTEINQQVWSYSNQPSLNRIATVIYPHFGRLRALGRPEEKIDETYNTRLSMYTNGQPNAIESSLTFVIRLGMPIASNENDNRISGQAVSGFPLLKYLTRIYPNSGETWNDFKARVYAHPYSWGFYQTSNNVGSAMNAGDYTTNGWKNGQVSIYEAAGKSSVEQMADALLGYNFPTLRHKKYVDLYGPNGRMKNGIPMTTLSSNYRFPNYDGDNFINSDFEYIYNDETGKEVKHTARVNTNVPSAQSTVFVPEGSSIIKLVDKDNSSLLENVGLNLDKKVNDNWVRQSTNIRTNATGIGSFLNLLPGQYRVSLNAYPTGYQNKITWKNGDSNTSINSSGEFTLVNKGSALITGELEKIKHQAVRFTVKDTAKKPIAGEVFSIMRNGQSVGTYPTDNYGVFSLARLNAGEYSLTPTNPLRTGARAFVVEEGKSNTLEVEAVLPVIPEITANGPSSLNLGNVNIGQITRSTIPLDVTYRGDNGYTVTARQSSNTNIDFELNDTLITTQEKEFTNLNGTANPVTTMINYQLTAKTNPNSTKGSKSTNIIFSFKYKL